MTGAIDNDNVCIIEKTMDWQTEHWKHTEMAQTAPRQRRCQNPMKEIEKGR